MSEIKVKKSFTLIELIIVIILISVSYYLIFSNSNFKIQDRSKMISIVNIKAYMLKNFPYEDTLSLLCIEDDLSCYIRIDGKIDEELKIENLFKIKPDVYAYTKDEEILEFNTINIENISENVFFELNIDKDFKTNELIVDSLNDKVYIFNSIFPKTQVYNSLSEAFDNFNISQVEVQDAF